MVGCVDGRLLGCTVVGVLLGDKVGGIVGGRSDISVSSHVTSGESRCPKILSTEL